MPIARNRTPSCKWCLAFGTAVVAMLAWAIAVVCRMQETARSTACRGHFAHFSSSFDRYEERHGHLPPAYDAASDGRRVHSWRAHIVSVVDSVTGAVPYDFDEPWDGPNNSRLAERPFEFLACPSDSETQNDKRLTNYFVVEGSATFPGSQCASLRDIRDRAGASNTLLVVEASGMNVRWSEPRDLTFEDIVQQIGTREFSKIAVHHPQGPQALMADGSVRSLGSIAPEVLKTRESRKPQ